MSGLPHPAHREDILAFANGSVPAIECATAGYAGLVLGGWYLCTAGSNLVERFDEARPVLCAAYSIGAPEPQLCRLILEMTQRESARFGSIRSEREAMGRFTGVLGLLLLLAAAWLFSTNRKAIRWRVVATGIALQVLFAVFVTKVWWGQLAIAKAGEGAKRLLACSFAGSRFVFGEAGAQNSNLGFIFAFQVLPAIIFIAAFFSILYYFGMMQFLIRMVAVVMEKTMGASGAESLNVAASIVMGQTEAPLTIRPYLPRLTQSELMVVMTAGMAHVSGGIMAAYIATGVAPEHLLAAVIMTAPGTLTVAKMLVPETEVPETASGAALPKEERASNVLEAAAKGTSDGLALALNVAAMLISFLAIIFLINSLLGGAHNLLRRARLRLVSGEPGEDFRRTLCPHRLYHRSAVA